MVVKPIHRLPAEDRVGFAVALVLFVAVSFTGILWATRHAHSGHACTSVACRFVRGGL